MRIVIARGDLFTSSQQFLWSDFYDIDSLGFGMQINNGVLLAETDFYIVNDRIKTGNQKQGKCAGKG